MQVCITDITGRIAGTPMLPCSNRSDYAAAAQWQQLSLLQRLGYRQDLQRDGEEYIAHCIEVHRSGCH